MHFVNLTTKKNCWLQDISHFDKIFCAVNEVAYIDEMCIASGFLDRRKTNNEVTEPFYMKGPNSTEPATISVLFSESCEIKGEHVIYYVVDIIC